PLIPRPPISPPLPYTTLFRSPNSSQPECARRSAGGTRVLPGPLGSEFQRAPEPEPLDVAAHRTGRHGPLAVEVVELHLDAGRPVDRKSTRLNSSHEWISYAVF